MNAIAIAAADRIAAAASLAAYRTFEIKRAQGGTEILTDREMLAMKLAMKMPSEKAWAKAGEWVVEAGLFSKIRGVVTTPGAQTRLARLHDWTLAQRTTLAEHQIKAVLVIEGDQIKVLLIGHQQVEIGWLNPKYAPALLPLIESGRVECAIKAITGGPDESRCYGLNVRIDLYGLTDDDIATYEVATRREEEQQRETLWAR